MANQDKAPVEGRRSDDVARRILDRIRNGELRPGDRLPNERELAVDLGVSRPVVREAISNLIGRGVVTPRGGSGSTVTAIGPDHVQESLALYLSGNALDYRSIHEVRELVETYAAGIAARRAQPGDVAHLTELVDRLEDEELDIAEHTRADVEFHAAITRLTGNEIFGLILASLHHGLVEVREHNLELPAAHHEAVRSHRAILEAIAGGEEIAARTAMAAHLHAVFMFWQERG
ncbi:FadR/GntR family transcriptional regulator [Glycomyces harbinensis]|uniref:GntR family transcriptional regulator, transcriptional repressor for pyruvate dehydrogenase complex n=1 Tax=Glycomyces harbinensis TaxID=58114 RepID=A0A1G7ATD4_9ACTN|nr:FadR/GntR family transcriptional regulator [Glycomyces harbinensis]SDE17196.1 GntR family transcriptional regulator, transcriptional repressor for pyruvate dehydrogenase complex [Glycomyces harbinensis]